MLFGAREDRAPWPSTETLCSQESSYSQRLSEDRGGMFAVCLGQASHTADTKVISLFSKLLTKAFYWENHGRYP